MRISKVAQRRIDDCSICAAAMVLDYPYERVCEDRQRLYGHLDGRTAWWEHYFEDQGLTTKYRPLSDLSITQR
jgi:hypothetical protein